jgi:hypothetical protein
LAFQGRSSREFGDGEKLAAVKVARVVIESAAR